MNTDPRVPILADVIWREAAGESVLGKVLVGVTVLTRAADPSPQWPNTIGGVVGQPLQFSCYNRDDPNLMKRPVETSRSYMESVEAAEKALAIGPGFCDHYHATHVSPSWARNQEPVARVGGHIFYKLRK